MAENTKTDEPAQTTTESAGASGSAGGSTSEPITATAGHHDAVVEAPFVDDIVIWAEKLDVPRVLTRSALEGLPKLGTSLLPVVNSLIKQGVTLAAIPTTSGIGASCYLVNLATLKKPDDNG
ncbi:MAG TPA: hypothetical protein VNO30_28145 [Kofleriaceae bacterium]|nr:hypothetical protein [Kofleriaceae bacterium]